MKSTTERIKPYPRLKSQNVRMLPITLKEFDFIVWTTNVCMPGAGFENTPPTVCKTQKMSASTEAMRRKSVGFKENLPIHC